MTESARFVRVQPGHLVPRYGTPDLLGAERVPRSAADKLAGKPAIVWSGKIVQLPPEFCRRYAKELRADIRAKAITECTRSDWDDQRASDAREEESNRAKPAKNASAPQQGDSQ